MNIHFVKFQAINRLEELPGMRKQFNKNEKYFTFIYCLAIIVLVAVQILTDSYMSKFAEEQKLVGLNR